MSVQIDLLGSDIPRVVIASACCCGIRCRWHGQRASKSKPIRQLEDSGALVVPICPEMLGGLPCPRPPVRTIRRRVYETDPETREDVGAELTDVFRAGAQCALDIAWVVGADAAYLLRMSPSCAPGGVLGRLATEAGLPVVPIW